VDDHEEAGARQLAFDGASSHDAEG